MDLPYSLTEHRPKQIGLIVLQADETLEPDMRRLLPLEVEVLVSRVPSGREVTSDTLAAMEPALTGTAALFPSGARFAAIGYGCTSGTAHIGAARIRALVQAGVTTPHVTEPVSALLAACRQLGIRRIGMISPYVETVSSTLLGVLRSEGLAVSAFASFNQAEEKTVARIDQDAVFDAACTLSAQAPDCEALFLSCTNLRTLDILDKAEEAVGKPVLSSNQVLGWHLCQLAGIAPPRPLPDLR